MDMTMLQRDSPKKSCSCKKISYQNQNLSHFLIFSFALKIEGKNKGWRKGLGIPQEAGLHPGNIKVIKYETSNNYDIDI